MTVANYKRGLSLTLAYEGGYVNHPSDPGGPTYKGITQRVYDAHRKTRGQLIQSVRYATSEEVSDIYKGQYWKLVRGDSLPAGLDYAVFDFAVNSGISRAVRYLQRQVGVHDDAVIGDETMAAVYAKAKADEELMIATLCANRLAFVRSLKTFSVFGKGWTRRIIGAKTGFQANDIGVIDAAIVMARGDAEYVMPTEIGKLDGEIPGKAIAPPEAEELFPLADPTDIDALRSANDELAAIIARGK